MFWAVDKLTLKNVAKQLVLFLRSKLGPFIFPKIISHLATYWWRSLSNAIC